MTLHSTDTFIVRGPLKIVREQRHNNKLFFSLASLLKDLTLHFKYRTPIIQTVCFLYCIQGVGLLLSLTLPRWPSYVSEIREGSEGIIQNTLGNSLTPRMHYFRHNFCCPFILTVPRSNEVISFKSCSLLCCLSYRTSAISVCHVMSAITVMTIALMDNKDLPEQESERLGQAYLFLVVCSFMRSEYIFLIAQRQREKKRVCMQV